MKKGFVVPLLEKIAFGVGDMPGNLTYPALQFYFVYYVVNTAGVPAHLAALVYPIGRVWGAVMDVIIGRISDRTESRFGRRRPYLLFGAIPLGLSFVLLWFIPFQSTTSMFVYYLMVVVLFNTIFSITTIPYNALHPELTQNYDERTTLSGFRIVCSFIANIIAAAGVAVIVDNIYPGRPAYRESYPVMGWIVAVLVVIMYLFTFLFTKERVKPDTQETSGIFQTLKSFWNLKEFRIVLALFLFNQIGADIFMFTIIFFLKDVIRIPENITFIVMGIPIITAIVAAPFWVMMGSRFGKPKTLMVSSIYFIAVLLFCLLAPVGNLPFVIGIAIFIGVGMSASQVLIWSILPDVIEIDEYENGERREGAFYGLTSLMYKAASAVAIGAAGSLIAYFGYVENSLAQPQSSLTAIRFLIGTGPAIFYLLTAITVSRLPITKERFEEVMKVLDERKKQKQQAI
jgi:GPH family glycoside/pentoside/hexuronide:cation symporter